MASHRFAPVVNSVVPISTAVTRESLDTVRQPFAAQSPRALFLLKQCAIQGSSTVSVAEICGAVPLCA